MNHEEARELLGAYALDAVEAEESVQVEDHLRECPRCRSELAGLSEAAALLAHSGGDAPGGVWERIAAETAGVQPAPALSLVIGDRSPAPKVAGRTWPIRVLAGAAAVAAAVAGIGVVHVSDRLNHVTAALAVSNRATAAAVDPDARHLALTTWGGRIEAGAAVLPDGTGYVIPAGLAALPTSRTYQLWTILGGRPVSAGLLGSAPGVTTFRMPAGTTVLAITDEPAGGSRAPTGALIASGSV
jgi:anti-sigma factor RsiW